MFNMYANFQEKTIMGISGKTTKLFTTTMKSLGIFFQKSLRRFFLENCHTRYIVHFYCFFQIAYAISPVHNQPIVIPMDNVLVRQIWSLEKNARSAKKDLSTFLNVQVSPFSYKYASFESFISMNCTFLFQSLQSLSLVENV